MINLLLIVLSILCCASSRILTEEERIEAVKVHNYLRRSAYPSAANMNELTYSKELELVVAKYLDKCHFAHMYHNKGYGENGRLANDYNLTRSAMNWYKEHVYYDWNKPYGERCGMRKEADNYLVQPQCGHYRMLMTHTLTKVGCAVKFCPTATSFSNKNYTNVHLTFCFYDKGPRDHPYTEGEPCTGCNNYMNRFCRDGLCVEGEKGECKIKCKRCQKIPDFLKNYCGCDCDFGDGNDCSEKGFSNTAPDNCKPCESMATPCKNGGQDVSQESKNCLCKCPNGYKGRYCELTPSDLEDLKNSAKVSKFGKTWLYGFKYPVDRYEFMRKWNSELRLLLASDINNACRKYGDFCDIEKVDPSEIKMAAGYPRNNEDGSMTYGVFVKYDKTGQYLDKRIVLAVLMQQATMKQ